MNYENSRYVYNSWTKSDPEAALESVRELELPALEGNPMQVAATRLAVEDPARSLHMLSEIGSRSDRTRGLNAVAASVARAHPRKVVSLAQTIENPYDQATFLRGAVRLWESNAEFYPQSQSDFSWIDELDAPSAAMLNRALARYAPELIPEK